jgi:peptidoglycan hydrolase-like protein with peptidoglycan-binding domain
VPFAPAPEGLLRPGAVAAIQGRLHATGFMSSNDRSGRLDAATRESLRRFQAKQDLPATGLPSYRTVDALRLHNDDIFFSARRPPSAATALESTDQGSVGTRAPPAK